MNPDPPVQRGRRTRVSTEQKLAILQQWQAGTPALELCRTHGLKANALYRWKKQLDHGLGDHGELIPKSRLLPLQCFNFFYPKLPFPGFYWEIVKK